MGVKLSPGGRGRGYRRRQFDDINVTPFVDVMLVLLVIFIVTAPMLTAGVQVELPEASAKPVAGNDEPVAVSVKQSGEIFIQETPVKLEELRAKLTAIVGEKRDTRIFVRGDTGSNYGAIMQVIGEVNAAGFTKVALITNPGGKK